MSTHSRADWVTSFFVDADIRDAIRRRASFNVIHLATMLKVDFSCWATKTSHWKKCGEALVDQFRRKAS
jgi:hypothetical protein